MPTISEETKRLYDAQGYVQVSGLIAPEIIDRAAEALLGLHAHNQDASFNRTGAVHMAYEDPALRATYTPALLEAIAGLVGDDPAHLPMPTIPYSIIIPTASDEQLAEYRHIDWMDANSRDDPGFRVTVMTYLSDVELGGGGTFVWPGSNRLVRKLLRDYIAYPTLAALQAVIVDGSVTFGEAIEATPKKGDVLFIESCMVHAGGINRNDTPRLALNWKW